MDRSDFIFFIQDRTVFFVTFIGQKCLFPKIKVGYTESPMDFLLLNDIMN